jgi:NDP-4-keto-2,6-dideoxyhexose 3-C-methyltransferase
MAISDVRGSVGCFTENMNLTCREKERQVTIKTRRWCRVCGGSLEPMFSLGEQYISDFLSPEQPDGAKAPLELVLCDGCKLLQLRHTVPAEFYKQYWYRSGTNQTMRNALADIANSGERLMKLKEGDTVLDIGCNDGTLLAAYQSPGLYKIGFDPAENLAVYSQKVADRVVTGFFDRAAYERELHGRRARVVTSIAMFYDLEDPNKFVSDIKEVMDPEGLWIVQMSYLPLMLKQHDFGNICHEHLEYYSLQALEFLLNRHGLEFFDLQMNDVNGGSLRAYIRNHGADETGIGEAEDRRQAAERVAVLRRREGEMGLGDRKPYREFGAWIERIKNDVFTFVREQVSCGKRVFVYGASTKGNAMLQYFGLDSSLIEAAADRNPDKWGRVTPGTRIPIISEEQARKSNPDYFLVLPWHFLDEFREREKDYLLAGGRFIVPLPHFALI